MLAVLISNQTRLWTVIEDRLTKAVLQITADHGYDDGEVSIAVVDDHQIQQLNLQYLDHDWPTDAISFIFEAQKPYLDGEIIVSVETAYRMCVEMSWSGDDELLLYVIHGSLHLIGMDDQDDESARRMREAERKYLIQFNAPNANRHGC